MDFFFRKTKTEKKQVAEVSDEVAFYLHHGGAIKSLSQLLENLRIMKDSQFEHHVTPDKNDFANWIDHILHDKELAEQMKNATSKSAAIYALEKHLKIHY